MNTEHHAQTKEKIQSAPLVAPPDPWKKIGSLAVGGLRGVGFDRNSELLLVHSSAGRGVIDCQTAEKVARDYEEYYGDEIFMECEGIGPLAGTCVRLASIFGGGLIRFTRDDWSIDQVTLDWPIQEVLLFPPENMLPGVIHREPSVFYKIFRDFQPIFAGFSYTGKTLLIANSSDIEIWGR